MKVETTNICNANCVFCANQFMTRKPQTMRQSQFENVIAQFESLGGRAIYLTPVIGDIFCDHLVLERLRFLRRPGSTIERVVIFTNLIALKKFSDDEVRNVLERIDSLIVSLAPTRGLYRELFCVDEFDNVLEQLRRIAALSPSLSSTPRIALSGKTTDRLHETDQRVTDLARSMGLELCWTDRFFDWGGTLDGSKVAVLKQDKLPVHVPCKRILRPVVFVDGAFGICSCGDYNAVFVTGNVFSDSMKSLLRSKQRAKFLKSFFSGAVSDHCRRCSFYLPDDEEALPQDKLLLYASG